MDLQTGALSCMPADSAVRSLMSALDGALPGRIRACYVLGSYSDASAVETSDLDITVVFRGRLSAEETGAARRRCGEFAAEHMIELDIEIEDEESLRRGASPSFKLGSTLIAGDDLREEVPLVSITDWTRDRMHTSWWRVARLFARPEAITLPLTYPEPADPFRGYVRRTSRLSNGEDVPCTRDLVRLTTWAATGLLSLQCGVYSTRKSEVHALYRQHVGGTWASFIEDAYTLCRARWGYLIPDEAGERVRLRELCDRTLEFEQYFASVYRKYLLSELGGTEREGVRFAAEAMGYAPLRDDDVLAALDTLTRSGDETIASLARMALARLYTTDNN